MKWLDNLMNWFGKNKNEYKQENEKRWRPEIPKGNLLTVDKDVLMFAMEESRAYLNKISENTNRLSNKGFMLLGIMGGIIVFIMNIILWYVGIAKTIKWPLILLVALCSFCLLRASYILLKIIFPASYFPLGSIPKNLLKEKVLGHKINEILVSQMVNYQERIEDNLKQNHLMSDDIEKSARWGIIYPIIIIAIWATIYLLVAIIITFFSFFDFLFLVYNIIVAISAFSAIGFPLLFFLFPFPLFNFVINIV